MGKFSGEFLCIFLKVELTRGEHGASPFKISHCWARGSTSAGLSAATFAPQ